MALLTPLSGRRITYSCSTDRVRCLLTDPSPSYTKRKFRYYEDPYIVGITGDIAVGTGLPAATPPLDGSSRSALVRSVDSDRSTTYTE
jgi:hypothetical protein